MPLGVDNLDGEQLRQAAKLLERENERLIRQVLELKQQLATAEGKGSEQLEVPAGTQHGEVFKLKGKGLPDIRSYRNGDELVQILVEVPKKLTEKQKQLLKDFAATEDDASVMPQRKGFVEKLKGMFAGDEK